MIEIKNISKTFSHKNIFKDLSLQIFKGESIAIIGQSGVGKSVLLKHINGLLSPDSGQVLIDKQNINKLSFSKKQDIRKKMSMVFQFGALFDSLPVSENISLALKKLTKLSEEEICIRVQKSLASVDMENTEDLMPAELSGGMKKRVGIARAIALDPDYLFYDEPTTGLDPVMTDSINRLIRKFQNSEQVTSVIVTHEMRTVYDVSDRVLLIHEGKIQFDGSPKEIKQIDDPIVQQFITGNSILV